jgi:hypothetical protein
MYIKDLKQIRHVYRCRKCDKICKNMEACNRHEKTCDELIKHKFPGGKYNKSQSIFDRIEELYNDLIKKEKTYNLYNSFNPVVSDENDKYYPYEVAFDFEAILNRIDNNNDDDKLKIVSEHVPVSVYKFSNVPEYDIKPIFLCHNDPKKLIERFVKTILKISYKAKTIIENKYNHIIKFLDAYVNNNQNDLERFKNEHSSFVDKINKLRKDAFMRN